jgi:hypothetical protein
VLLLGLAADDLPGVGYATREKLDALGICSVADVRARPRQALQRELGAKTGASVRYAPPEALCTLALATNALLLEHPPKAALVVCTFMTYPVCQLQTETEATKASSPSANTVY